MQITNSRLCRRALFQSLATLGALGAIGPALAGGAADPLPSWRPGKARSSITDFVARVVALDSPDFVPPAQRIAVFDNDGTLWAEQPVYFQFAFAIDELKRLAPLQPEWKTQQPFAAALSGDLAAVAASGAHGLESIIGVTHAGITTDDFAGNVSAWLATARHPTRHCPYTKLVYRPMLELLSYLRANSFKTFIVSGGGVEFMRVFAETVYGIPPEQVVGSSGAVRFQFAANGAPVLIKEPKIEFIDDGPGKPVGINRFIGRRPILAFGNSDGDQQMLEWTAAGQGARLAALVHHTDAAREWAYDRASHVGQLDKALDEATAKGWTVVDMKGDWAAIFPDPA